jgi:SsrA-binding protein
MAKLDRKSDNLATNKKAYHNYHILETYEAGIALVGTEVKSIRNGKVDIVDGLVRIRGEEAFLEGVHVHPYTHGNIMNHDPDRSRKLLLHRHEIRRLMGKIKEKGLTLVPTRFYLKDGRIKVELALAKGKRMHDKREAIKAREAGREMERAVKGARSERSD